jgi:hypothetical protein
VDPAGYTRLLCTAYRRIKEADPEAIVLTGALAQTIGYDFGPGPWTGMNEFVFLQRMYDAGAAACFDVLAVNDYILWSAPTDRRMRPWAVTFARPVYLRDLMVANGDAHKPIWLSEMNANAVPDNPTIQNFGAYGQVTPEQQARYAPLAYERALRSGPGSAWSTSGSSAAPRTRSGTRHGTTSAWWSRISPPSPSTTQ